jgi:hypothetical protein
MDTVYRGQWLQEGHRIFKRNKRRKAFRQELNTTNSMDYNLAYGMHSTGRSRCQLHVRMTIAWSVEATLYDCHIYTWSAMDDSEQNYLVPSNDAFSIEYQM